MVEEQLKKMEELCIKLQKENPNNEYIPIMEKIIKELLNDKKPDYEEYLQELQTLENKIYEQIGFNQTVLDIQVCINMIRNKLDIPDKSEIIHTDANGTYVQ